MARTMRAFARRTIFLAALAVIPLVAAIPRIEWAIADHGGALRSAPMSPALVGLIAGGLALAAGAVVLIIVKLLFRKAPPSK
jgi:hypothetical protein